MHRLLLVALALLAVPGATASILGFEDEAALPAGQRRSWALDAAEGDAFLLDWSADAPLDVLVVQAANASVLDDAAASPRFAAELLNQTSGRAHVTLGSNGPWLLVLDNTAAPAAGAPGNRSVQATVAVAPYLLEVPRPPGPSPAQVDRDDGAEGEGREPPTLWNTLLFDSWTWRPADGLGFGGVALWALVVLAACCVGFQAPLRPTVQATLAATAFVLAWSLVPLLGPMTEVGLPALAGLALAWFMVDRVERTADVLRATLVAAILGAFAGDVLAHALRHLGSEPGDLVFGNRRFVDEVFTLPGFALAGVLLFKVIPELVHAIEGEDDDGAPAAGRGPMQGDTFTVTCLRCRTEIKVDRSMKRWRVATDRFEFPCPNCQYWMEWADPNRKGAAAA